MPYDFDAEVEEMRLTLKERKLYKLLRAETKPISREEIHNILWRDCCVCESNLRVQIHNLRKKLKPKGYHIVCHQGEWTLERPEIAIPA